MRVLGELRIALRTLLRAPGFFALSTTILALGIAAVVVMFGLLRVTRAPPPLEGIDRVYSLTVVSAGRHQADRWIPVQDLDAWAREQRSFEALAGFTMESMTLRRMGAMAEQVNGSRVTGRYFELLRIRPLLGRVLGPDDGRVGATPAIVLSERLWRTTFEADPEVVGETVRLNGSPALVVGVAPAALDLPVGCHVWVPDQTNLYDGSSIARVVGPWVHPLGRLKDGVTPDAARAELQAIQVRRAQKYPDAVADRPEVRSLSLVWLPEEFQGKFRALFASVLLVLALACVNVAGLLLVRGAGRTHEAAVRRALGAGRLRLASQMLAEAVVIGAAGGLLGMTLAAAASEVLARAVPAAIPYSPAWWRIELDGPMAAFALGTSVVATLGAALFPAIRTSRVSIDPLLREGVRDTGLRSARLVRWLVVAEIALSAAILTVAGLTIRSAAKLGHGDVGVPTSGFLLARLELPQARYDLMRQESFAWKLGERLRAIPGVEAATLTTAPPGITASWRELYQLGDRSPGRMEQLPSATIVQIDEGFFETFRVPTVRGRALGKEDSWIGERSMMVNEAVAETQWPGGDAIGKTVKVLPQEPRIPASVVVGVAGNVRHDDRVQSLGGTPPTIYLPLLQWPAHVLYIVARGPKDPLVLAAGVRDAVRTLDPDLAVDWVRTLDEERARNAAPHVLLGAMFAVFGAVALALAAAGVYGVFSYSVTQGAREIAIRRAMGAPDWAIVLAVVARAAWQLLLGLLLGIVLAPVTSELAKATLGEQGHPLVVYLGVAGLLTTSLVVALAVPLWRALRLEPSSALRHT
jgi:predicted permease